MGEAPGHRAAVPHFELWPRYEIQDLKYSPARALPARGAGPGRVDHVASRTNGRGVDDDGPRRSAASNAVGEARTVERRRRVAGARHLEFAVRARRTPGIGRVVEARRALARASILSSIL